MQRCVHQHSHSKVCTCFSLINGKGGPPRTQDVNQRWEGVGGGRHSGEGGGGGRHSGEGVGEGRHSGEGGGGGRHSGEGGGGGRHSGEEMEQMVPPVEE